MTITLKSDAGATKTDWLLCIEHNEYMMRTQGINPVTQTSETIFEIILTELIANQIKRICPQLNRIDSLQFYGAGCIDSLHPIMKEIIDKAFMQSGIAIDSILIGSDIIGAAIALFGRKEGIACILGTGSNSCVYNGYSIVANTPPLGYILGDEGSGAAIGRRFVNALYKGRLPYSIMLLFEDETGLKRDDIINNVYKQPLAARFLASLSEFVGRHIDKYECLHNIVSTEFQNFICNNIEPYHRTDLEIGAVGGVAWHYRDILAATIRDKGYKVGKIIKSPLAVTGC